MQVKFNHSYKFNDLDQILHYAQNYKRTHQTHADPLSAKLI